ncbi:MAG: ABC transporter permease [Candidatus Pacebacteria bacterium]|nr:ABC transporter permease [Candidatus Paceibacterota bacterium]
MKLHHIAQEGAQALRANLLRSSLTIVGIVVGIFAVTAMLALGEGLSQNIVGRISSFTQGDVSISGALTEGDLAWIKEQAYVSATIGSVQTNNPTFIAHGTDFNVSTQVVLGDLQAVQPFTVAEGVPFDFSNPAIHDAVAVVTKTLNDAVVKEVGQGLLDQYVSVGGQQYQVVGIIDVASAGFSRNDGTVYLPYGSAIGTLTTSSNFSSVGVKLKDSNYFEIAGLHLLAGLNTSRYLVPDSTDMFTVSSAQSIIESVQETTGMISLFLGIVGGIALFVGGIGTMNMMLTTVTERTREIGLRKAIGARRQDILLQILIESVFLTFVGGALGIVLTMLGAYFANQALANNANTMISVIVSSRVVAFATAVAIAVGIVFGLYPANRASKLQPVDALRAE